MCIVNIELQKLLIIECLKWTIEMNVTIFSSTVFRIIIKQQPTQTCYSVTIKST